MGRRWGTSHGVSTVIAILALCTLVAGTATAMTNTAPLADAGLDQTASVDATVYLDANGSSDPDGSLAVVNWTITAPDGTTVRPDCRTCWQTAFVPRQAGEYAVTLTVTDDSGTSATDTMYVSVSQSSGPSVSLSGPSSIDPGAEATVTADVTAVATPLASVTWVANGSTARQEPLNGRNASVSYSDSPASAQVRTYRVIAHDTRGDRATATHRVAVGDVGRDEERDCHFWENDCLLDTKLVNPNTGEVKWVNADGTPGIQFLTDDGLANVSRFVDLSNRKSKTGVGY